MGTIEETVRAAMRWFCEFETPDEQDFVEIAQLIAEHDAEAILEWVENQHEENNYEEDK